MMSIYWMASVAFSLHGQPFGQCKMIGENGDILAIAMAGPSLYDNEVAVLHFNVEDKLVGKVRFECKPMSN